jgi:hypothetical protein
MRFFRHEIEVALKALGVVALVALIVLPAAWGYEQRRQARAWQNVACSYRLKEVTRSTRFVAHVERGSDACALLERLGLSHSDTDVRLESEFVVLPARAAALSVRQRPVTR